MRARLVGKGFHQQYGLDFHEKFSPVVKQTIICIILTLKPTHDREVQKTDINNTFLNSDLKEEVYMEQPQDSPPLILTWCANCRKPSMV